MKVLSSNYLKKVSTVATLIFFVTALLFLTILKDYYIHIIPFILIYLVSSSIFFHRKLILAQNKSTIQFNSAFLASIALKLLFNLIFIIVYLVFYKQNLIVFVSYFMILYFVFLIFDVKAILSEITKFKKD